MMREEEHMSRTRAQDGEDPLDPPYLFPDYVGTRLRAPAGPLVALPHHLTEVTGASLLALMGLFDVIGTTCSGWLTDRLDPRHEKRGGGLQGHEANAR